MPVDVRTDNPKVHRPSNHPSAISLPARSSADLRAQASARDCSESGLNLTCEGFDPCWKDVHAPKAFPAELVMTRVAVARKGRVSVAPGAGDFGVSESCLQRWLKLSDTEDGKVSGVTAREAAETRELRKWIRLLESGGALPPAGKRGSTPGGGASV
jgi:transposase